MSGLTGASGTVPTQRGDVKVSWQNKNGHLTLTADVPVNVKAEIDLPTTGKVKVSGDARYAYQKDGHTVYETGSGHVEFNAAG